MPRPVRFLLMWAVALLALLALVAGFNAVINPYEVFAWQRIPWLNEYKPGTRNHVALAKAYQVERARPVTVILGTSRVYLCFECRESGLARGGPSGLQLRYHRVELITVDIP